MISHRRALSNVLFVVAVASTIVAGSLVFNGSIPIAATFVGIGLLSLGASVALDDRF